MGIARNDAIPMVRQVSAVLIIAGILCWIIKLLNDTYTVKERLWQAALLCIGALAAYFNHHLGCLLIIMAIIGMKNVRFRIVLSAMLGIQTAALVIHSSIFAADLLTGKVDGYYETRRVLGLWDISEQYRIFFGELHPNGIQKLIGMVSAIWSYLNYKKLCMKHLAVLTCVNIAFYFITYSNTGLMLWLVFAAMLLITKKEFAWLDQAAKISPWLFLFMAAFIVAITYFYSPKNMLIEFLNRCVTARFHWANEHLYASGLSLWGKSLDPDLAYLPLDCGYINLLLCYGTVLFGMYILGTAFTLRYLADKKMYPEIALVWFLQLFFIIESFILVLWMNATFVYMSGLLYDVSMPLAGSPKGNCQV